MSVPSPRGRGCCRDVCRGRLLAVDAAISAEHRGTPDAAVRDADVVDVPVFAALDTGHTVDADGRRLPTVAIDTAGAPEVADLARVHIVEGIGDIRTAAVRTDDLLVLGIRVTVPVRAAFAIAFHVARHRALLDDIIEHGSLVIAHTDPQLAPVEQPHWLAVDIDGAALAACVAAE